MDYGKAPFERMLRGDKGESNEEFAERMVPARAYTEVRLSFEKDCLIPLSGLAKRMREKLGLTYSWGRTSPRALM